MFEFVLGAMLSWPFVIGLLVLGCIFEANEAHGWAVFTGLVAAVVAYFVFNVPFADVLTYAAIYLVVGFVWSFWRYKRHCDKVVEDNLGTSDSRREYAINSMRPSGMLGSLTSWVLIWPFSMAENVTRDIINLVQTAITKVFKGIYNRIYNSAVDKLRSQATEGK